MNWRVWIFVLLVVSLILLADRCDRLRWKEKFANFAYAAGTTVQTTGEGALFYCHGEPIYLHIKHSAPMTALLRRYIEAECS